MNDATNAPDNKPEKDESAKDAELREQSHPDSPLPIRKNGSKKKLIVILISVLVLVGVILAAVFLLMPKSSAPTVSNNNDQDISAATKFKSADSLIESVNTKLSGPLVQVAEASGYGGKTADGFGAYSVPPYKVGDRKFSNLPADSFGVSRKGTSVEEAANYTALTKYFKDNKFKQLNSGTNTVGINQWFSQELNYVSYASYESPDMLCMIWHVDATPTSIKNHVTSVGCASKASYQAAAKELDQFYTAYAKGTTGGREVVLGMPSGTDGAGDYVNMSVYMEDPDQLDTQFQGLFYKTGDQKEWTYFTGAYGLLSCTEYNTDVLKKAFKGYNCWNDATKTYSTVS